MDSQCHYPHNNHNGSSEFSALTLTIWNENGFARYIHFRIHCIQMLAKQSLESQAYQILMWHASALFSNFLWVKPRRQRRPMSPFHLYNNRVQRQNALPNSQFHQIQDKFKKLGRVLFCTGTVGTVFCSCISMSSTSSNGILGEDSKHQRLPGYHFFEDSQMQSIGQCMLALGNFNIIYPDPDMKLFFLPTVSAGFQAGELGEIHFGLGRTPVKWCENGRKMRNLT